MSAFIPVALYGLEVPPGEILVPAARDFPAHFRITMAAIDPTEAPEADEDGNIPSIPRSTLKLIKTRAADFDDDDEDDDELDDETMKALLAASDEDDEEDDDEEPNGGPSDPSKAKTKGSRALQKLLQQANDEDDESSDEEMGDAKPNGVISKKGKEKASDDDDEDISDLDDGSDDSDQDLEEFVICTLDTDRNYQQPIDIHVNEGEKVFFLVSGTHTIFLTGNYLLDPATESDSDEDDEYDLSPDEADYDLEDGVSDDESDELDAVADPRITEVESEDEEEAPKLVAAAAATGKKGKNKRPAEDEAGGLDDLIASSKAAEEPKLSKKQLKKLKNNKGEAVAAAEDNKSAQKNGANKSDKKVQFAKELEQGPTGSGNEKKAGKPELGVKVVQGVTIDDRKVGTGRTAKNGDTVSMRYIGKLPDGKQFDANKKGKPFTFKLGKGEVIKGWDIGVVGMTIGGERRLTIPPSLAYGNKAQPGLPANSTLTFDVKLLEIK